MKKKISLLLILVFVISSLTSSYAVFESASIVDDVTKNINRIIGNKADNTKAATEILGELIKFATSKFSDVKENDWYIDTVSRLLGFGGIVGFNDGTFRPNLEMKQGEFIKTIVASLGFDEGISGHGHWSSNYRRKAVLIGLVDASEFQDLEEVITRNEMAKIAIRTLEYNNEKFTEDFNKYTYQIKDYNNIEDEYKDYVLKAYVKGIITGYEKGSFQGDRSLSRAEASTVIIRILDNTERKMPPALKEENKKTTLTESDIKRLQNYPLNPMYYADREGAVNDYEGFEQTYTKYTDDCKLASELLTPHKYIHLINISLKNLKENLSNGSLRQN